MSPRSIRDRAGRRAGARLAAIALAAGTLSCGSATEPRGVEAKTIVVTPDQITLPQADSVRLDVSVLDASDALISGIAVSFASSDTSVFDVSNLGWVRASGHAGQAQVVVRSGGISTQVPVTVTPVLAGVVVTPAAATMPQKGTLQLRAAVVDAVGDTVRGAPLTFSSANQALAVVSADGLVVSAGPAGQTTIVVSSDSLTTTVPLTIQQVPTSISGASSLDIGKGAQLQLRPSLLDAVGTPIPGATFEYASSDAGTITVSSSGLLTSVGPLGSATITITSGTITKKITVTAVDATHPQGTVAATTSIGGTLYGVAVSRAGVVYAVQLGDALVRADLPSFTFGAPFPISGASSAAFAPGGATAYVSKYSGGGLAIVDVASNAVTGTIPVGNPGNAYDVAVARDGSRVFMSGDGHVYVMDPAAKSVLFDVAIAGAANHISPHPSLPLVYASLFTSHEIDEVNVQTGAISQRFAVTGTPQGTVVSPDGTLLYIANEAGRIDILNLSTKTIESSVQLGCGGFGIAMTPDGTQLWVACGYAGQVKIVDIASRTVTSTISTNNSPRRIAFDATGTTAVVVGDGGTAVFVQ
ncbi:MAG TPA: Ig-like domain-containing protein [Gemmatimonadaceae bacterium]